MGFCFFPPVHILALQFIPRSKEKVIILFFHVFLLSLNVDPNKMTWKMNILNFIRRCADLNIFRVFSIDPWKILTKTRLPLSKTKNTAIFFFVMLYKNINTNRNFQLSNINTTKRASPSRWALKIIRSKVKLLIFRHLYSSTRHAPNL